MVLDESALEAMLARQRASEQGHEQAPSIRTVKTDEFEVYERQTHEPATPTPETARQPAPTPQPAPPHAATPQAAPMPRQAARASEDFEELPGRLEEAPSPAPQPPAEPPMPQAATQPATPAPQAAQPAQAPQPVQHAQAPPAQQAPQPAPPATSQTAPVPPAEARRPQVWPPIGRKEAAPAEAATLEATPATGGQMAPTFGDAMRGSIAPTDEPATQPTPHAPAFAQGANGSPRTHSPTPHAFPPPATGGNGCRIAIVQAMFNQEITDAMTEQATARATAAGAQVVRHQVPGVYDLPLTVQTLARRKDVDAVVVIGCVVRGETKHDELITFTTAKTLQEIALATDTPIGLGITGPGMTWQQAQARMGNGAHAVDAAISLWQTLQKA